MSAINWTHDFDAALEWARSEGKLVLLDRRDHPESTWRVRQSFSENAS